MQIKKILYVTHGDINYMIDENMYETLIDMGYEVIYFNYVELEKQIGKDSMNKSLIYTCKYLQPDILFMILYTDQIDFETIDACRNHTVVVNWFCDDQWRYHDNGNQSTKYWIKHLDYAITTAPEALEWYEKDGFNNAILSSWAANPKYYYPMNMEKIYDVSFVGQKYGTREAIVNHIKKSGIDIRCFGRGWQTDYVPFEDMVKIFNQSYICLNISECSKGGGNQPKGREFEIPCTGGGILFTGKTENIENYFDIDKEIVVYENNDDLVDKIKYYLLNKNLIADMSACALKRTLRDHTYKNRFEQIFKVIENER